MTNSTKKKQTLHISLEVLSRKIDGEPIAEIYVAYSGDPVIQVYDVFDEELAKELDHIQTPAGIAAAALESFAHTCSELEDCDVDVIYHSSCHFLCDSAKCLVPSVPGEAGGDCPPAGLDALKEFCDRLQINNGG